MNLESELARCDREIEIAKADARVVPKNDNCGPLLGLRDWFYERGLILAEIDKLPFASGGIRSHLAPRFDLIPRAFLECLADRLELGLAKKGAREILQRYKRGSPAERDAILDDEGWWVEMRNHLQDHLIYLRDGDFADEGLWGHAGAVMWNAGMLAWRERELQKRELGRENPTPAPP